MKRMRKVERKLELLLCLLFVLVCIANSVCCVIPQLLSEKNKNNDNNIVKTPCGEIRGISNSPYPGTMAFKGVPYAVPPVGNLRWKIPEPAECPYYKGFVDATQYSSPCPQFYFNGSAIGSEDCLYLNVWAPSSAINKPQSRLPVWFYVHGGDLMTGDGSGMYDFSTPDQLPEMYNICSSGDQL